MCLMINEQDLTYDCSSNKMITPYDPVILEIIVYFSARFMYYIDVTNCLNVSFICIFNFLYY